MARAAKKRAARAHTVPVEGRSQASVASEALLLLVLTAAPLLTGQADPRWPLVLSCLVWVAFLLRIAPGDSPPLVRLSRPVTLLALLFPGLAAVTLLTSVNRGATLLQVLLWASCAAVFWLAADLRARGGTPRLLAALLGGGLISAAMGLQEYLVSRREGYLAWRIFGTPPSLEHLGVFGFANPNFYAAALAVFLLLGLSLALRRPAAFKPSMWALVLGLCTGSVAAALLATGSKGGLVSVAAGLPVLLLAGARAGLLRQRETLVRLGALLVVLAVVAGAFSTTLIRREQARAAALPDSLTLPEELCPPEGMTPPVSNPFRAARIDDFRYLTWKGSALMALRRPLLGWGAGSFDTAFAAQAIAAFTRHAHNTYLQLAAEEGLAAPLVWLGLLALGCAALWNMTPDPEWSWAPGALGGLVASGLHNGVDSLLYVPAVGLLTWTLLGMALAGDPPALSREGGPRRLRSLLAGGAALLLALSAACAAGRFLLSRGEAQLHRLDRFGAAETLKSARLFLPWDHEVAEEQRQAALSIGKFDEAVDAGRRAVAFASWRPPGYEFLGDTWRLQGGLENQARAAAIYQAGLDRAPRDVHLLSKYAGLRHEMGDYPEALEAYRRLTAVEESPVAQVRALEEVLDHRFARARMALATGATEPAETFRQRRLAACFLARRRRLFDRNPVTFAAIGEWLPRDPRDNERQLRNEEVQLWQLVGQEFRRRGENHLADLAEAEVRAAETSRDGLAARTEEFLRANP